MENVRITELVVAMEDVANVDGMVAAAKEFQETATSENVPRILEVLTHDSFFVREAAAWALSWLNRVDTLPQLLDAFQRGAEEGHDNDGFSAALLDLVELNRESARQELEKLSSASDPALGDNAKWLLEFCVPPGGS